MILCPAPVHGKPISQNVCYMFMERLADTVFAILVANRKRSQKVSYAKIGTINTYFGSYGCMDFHYTSTRL